MTGAVRTEVEVANLALGHARELPIGDFEERTASARHAKKWFNQARDEALAAAHWSFAKAWVQPAKDATPSLGPLKNRYPLPPDCIAVRYIEGASREEWDVEGGIVNNAGASVQAVVLVTNLATPLVCYTQRITNPALWSPGFVAAMAFRLGAYIANELARSRTLGADLLNEFEASLPIAERQDGRQRRAEIISRDTSWVRARRGLR